VYRQLENIRSFRPRSALDDFLERTVIHEKAGARMSRIPVLYALLGAILTTALGVVAEGTTSGFIGVINVTSWLAVAFGALLIITASCLSQARKRVVAAGSGAAWASVDALQIDGDVIQRQARSG
jgi:hypothetical protein